MGKVRICAAQFAVEREFSKNLYKSEHFMKRAQKTNAISSAFQKHFSRALSAKEIMTAIFQKKPKKHFQIIAKIIICSA